MDRISFDLSSMNTRYSVDFINLFPSLARKGFSLFFDERSDDSFFIHDIDCPITFRQMSSGLIQTWKLTPAAAL